MRFRGRLDSSGSSGSYGCALGVAGFVRVRLDVGSVSQGSFGFVWFVLIDPGSRWVR